jgi:hypothetical protein
LASILWLPLNIDLRDSLAFSIQETETIRDEDDYGGFRVKITGMLENIRQKIPLDSDQSRKSKKRLQKHI